MHKITFLGPVGATFSHVAYDALAEIYEAPSMQSDTGEYLPASSNGEVLDLLRRHGGYGAIAMETRAGGRVAETLESFINLLEAPENSESHNLCIVGALRMRIHFCLMARPSTSVSSIKRIVAHAKAQGACRTGISAMGASFVEVASNGEAARLIAENEEYSLCAALGPRSASDKYGLTIINEAFEDTEAVTTFFLVAEHGKRVFVGKENRLLIVFRVPHRPGAIVRALMPFTNEGLNLIQIHSVYAGNHTYNFVIEVEVMEYEIAKAERAINEFKAYVDKHLIFGPFEVRS